MPTYAYACTSCDHRFEVQQSFSDSTLTECPQCEGRIRKLFNSVGIVFKGSGFYRNDSRSGPTSDSSTSDTADKPAAKSSDKSSDKTSDKSPDTSAGTTSSSTSGGGKGKASPSSSSSAA